MKLTSKQRTEIIKAKNQRNTTNMKSENTERRKPSFTKKKGRKRKLI